MKTILIASIALITLLACANAPSDEGKVTSMPVTKANSVSTDTTINFNTCEVNKLPNGFTATSTGAPQILNWQIIEEKGNKVVAQLAANQGDYYNLLVLDHPVYKNLTISVRIKAVSGDEDQGGGLVWRYIDNNNYYIVRYNPLENNLRLYHVVKGNRIQLKSVNSNIGSNEWFTLSVTMNGTKITCSLNGSKLIETTDDVFIQPGKIGFWTKADAVTYFNDMKILGL